MNVMVQHAILGRLDSERELRWKTNKTQKTLLRNECQNLGQNFGSELTHGGRNSAGNDSKICIDEEMYIIKCLLIWKE